MGTQYKTKEGEAAASAYEAEVDEDEIKEVSANDFYKLL